MVRRILRAIDRLERLKAGATIAAIAKDERVTPTFITQTIDAALLSPVMLAAIAEGRQPLHLTASALQRMSLPIAWREQEAALLS